MNDTEKQKLQALLKGMRVESNLNDLMISEIESETATVEQLFAMGRNHREFAVQQVKAGLASDYTLESQGLLSEEDMDIRATMKALEDMYNGDQEDMY